MIATRRASYSLAGLLEHRVHEKALTFVCILVVSTVTIFSPIVDAGQVTLAWDPSPSQGIGGYRVYYGLTSKSYTGNIDAGNLTTATVSGLTEGQTYYFAVAAYNRPETQESATSNEVSAQIPYAVPVAAFTATPTSGQTPLTVAFSDDSTGTVTSWSWDFGDGETSTVQNPTHVYASAGDYTVRLTVNGPGGVGTTTETNQIQATVPDDDNDGMPNAFETANGLNPQDPSDATQDPDADGLNNLAEFQAGTDPNNPDTNGDGILDGEEIPSSRNPAGNEPVLERTFVSGSGTDTNPCSLTSPCRTLQAAVDAVAPGGEVVPLDSASYGDLVITKAVTISTPPGIIASVTASSGNAVDVSAADTAIVTLRGLSLTGLHSADVGIYYRSGGTLIVEGVTVSGFDDGLAAYPTTPSSVLVVRQSAFADNASAGANLGAPQGASLTATVSETFFTSNGHDGLTINSANVVVTVKNSVAAANGNVGFSNQNGGSLDIENCVTTGNQVGVDGYLVGNIRLSNSTVTANDTGIGNDVITRQNNTVEGNGTNGTFAGTFLAK